MAAKIVWIEELPHYYLVKQMDTTFKVEEGEIEIVATCVNEDDALRIWMLYAGIIQQTLGIPEINSRDYRFVPSKAELRNSRSKNPTVKRASGR